MTEGNEFSGNFYQSRRRGEARARPPIDDPARYRVCREREGREGGAEKADNSRQK